MALAPVWASICPIFTTSWAAAGATVRASTARSSMRRFIEVSSTLRVRVGRTCRLSPRQRVENCPSERKPLGDDLFHDLGGAGGDGPQPRVAEEALPGELPHVAVAAVELHGLVGDPIGHLSGKELGHGYLGDAVLAIVVELGGSVEEGARR